MTKHKIPMTIPDFLLTEKHRNLLKHARQLLTDETYSYICPALEQARGHLHNEDTAKEYERAGIELERYIARALEESTHFHKWQEKRGLYKSPEHSRKWRRRWLKRLILIASANISGNFEAGEDDEEVGMDDEGC